MNGLNEAETMPASLEVTREARLKWLMQQYGEKIFHLVSLTVKNHALADDITQNVFIQAYRHLDQYRGDGQIKHWLYKIAMNESKKHFRSWSFRNIFPTMDDHLGDLMDPIIIPNKGPEEINLRVEGQYYKDLIVAENQETVSIVFEVPKQDTYKVEMSGLEFERVAMDGVIPITK
ncbi:sigma factor [Brevibacillus formosus]|uniref:sigma factor n=1 Tax=Brevibacillus formosus TaxID=54913 RepID=UPI001F32A709|nr:sigma factor [Brevibacillus formosus]